MSTGNKLNHKRYVRTIMFFRGINADKRAGLQEFLSAWDELLSFSLNGIMDLLNETDHEDLLDIKDEASNLYMECLCWLLQNPKEYDSQYFDDQIYKLIERQYDIILDYYIDNDRDETNINQRILDLSEADLVISKRRFKGRVPNLKEYIQKSLNFFEHRKPADRENKETPLQEPVTEHQATSKVKSTIHYNGVPVTADEVALILIYRGRSTLSRESSPIECVKYGMAPGERLYLLIKQWKDQHKRQLVGETRVKIQNQIRRLNNIKPLIGDSIAANQRFDEDMKVLQENNI